MTNTCTSLSTFVFVMPETKLSLKDRVLAQYNSVLAAIKTAMSATQDYAAAKFDATRTGTVCNLKLVMFTKSCNTSKSFNAKVVAVVAGYTYVVVTVKNAAALESLQQQILGCGSVV
jgi:hypothetical protein